MSQDLVTVERLFKALASVQRLEMLRLVFREDDICAKDIADAVGLSQPDVSYHLSKLYQADIVGKEKQGTRNCYYLKVDTLKRVGITPQELLDNKGVN